METTKKTNRKTIAIATAIAIVAAGGACAYAVSNPLTLSTDNLDGSTLAVEYGTSIPTDASYYLAEDVDEEIISETTVTITAVDEEAEETYADYEAIGEYDVTLAYGSKTRQVSVTVADTIAPVLSTYEGIDTLAGVELDWDELITATDLSEVTLEFDDSEVDLDTVGTYTLYVTASDTSGNVTEAEITVSIEAMDEDVVSTEVTISGDGKISVTSEKAVKATTTNTSSGTSTLSGSTSSKSSSSSSSSSSGSSITSSKTSSSSSNDSSSSSTKSGNSNAVATATVTEDENGLKTYTVDIDDDDLYIVDHGGWYTISSGWVDIPE